MTRPGRRRAARRAADRRRAARRRRMPGSAARTPDAAPPACRSARAVDGARGDDVPREVGVGRDVVRACRPPSLNPTGTGRSARGALEGGADVVGSFRRPPAAVELVRVARRWRRDLGEPFRRATDLSRSPRGLEGERSMRTVRLSVFHPVGRGRRPSGSCPTRPPRRRASASRSIRSKSAWRIAAAGDGPSARSASAARASPTRRKRGRAVTPSPRRRGRG
jgi:hypothetical protein